MRLARSQLRTAIRPTSPVRCACVPPHGDQSKSAISTTRTQSVLKLSLRNGNRPASSGVTRWRRMARSSNTTALARSSARPMAVGISSGGASSVRSISATWSKMRKPLVSAPKSCQKACERICCPVCCCSISNRRDQSTSPATVSPTRKGTSPSQVMQHTAIIRRRNCRHTRRIDGSRIVWLPATARVEGGLIEHHHPVAVLDKTVYYLSGKVGQLGIVPVEFRGHRIIHVLCVLDGHRGKAPHPPLKPLPEGEGVGRI